MRFQIATLVFLVISSNALAVPHRRDIVHHDSIPTSRRSLENLHQNERRNAYLRDNRLDARGPNIKGVLNGLQAACGAWTHAKDAGLIKKREIFGDEVTLDARGPSVKDIWNGLQAACGAWTHAKDAGLV